jgi:hypothetical protein
LRDAYRPRHLRYFNDDGTIVVTTPRGDARRVRTRVYVISHLVHDWPTTPEQEAQLNEEITRLFTETVDPESWQNSGGVIGSIRVQDGLMTVRQTPENLRLVSRLLEQLREVDEAERLRGLLREGAP